MVVTSINMSKEASEVYGKIYRGLKSPFISNAIMEYIKGKSIVEMHAQLIKEFEENK